jgi:thioredoxin 1
VADASPRILRFSDATWEHDVLASAVPALVDFWAEWCRPCQFMEPSLEAALLAHDGLLRVGRLNVEENPETTERYNVKGLPTLIVVKGGKVTARRVGLLTRAALLKLLAETLGENPKGSLSP